MSSDTASQTHIIFNFSVGTSRTVKNNSKYNPLKQNKINRQQKTKHLFCFSLIKILNKHTKKERLTCRKQESRRKKNFHFTCSLCMSRSAASACSLEGLSSISWSSSCLLWSQWRRSMRARSTLSHFRIMSRSLSSLFSSCQIKKDRIIMCVERPAILIPLSF